MKAFADGEKKKLRSVDTMFEDVYAELPPSLQRQKEECLEFIRNHSDQYPTLERHEK